ncbi:hypothetical protein BGZ93_000181 [Podila epicladia]|nr:hypothetical protein BGZ92_000960 [Podila epicladia]KAG0098403.1 hypothetical protein BGZ93_000181 [Podila epicladia]
MARFTSLLVACAMVIVSLSAQVTSTCVVNTPQFPKDVLQVGKPYTVTFTGCTGVEKSVMLCHGNPKALKTDEKRPACAHVDLSTGSCTFTPKKAGEFAFSIKEDGAVEASYSAFFNVTTAPAPKVVSAKPTEDTASTEKEPAPNAANGAVPASPKVPTPVLAGKGPQPMAMKPEAKMVPSSSSKADAARKANAKRALYDIAAFAL